MARDANLVAFCIAEICPIVIRVIVRPQSGWALTLSAVRNSGSVRGAHSGSVTGTQGHHLAIAWIVGVTVKGLADDEVRARALLADSTVSFVLLQNVFGDYEN